MFTGFEADLIQGRHHIALGFANPALYNMANTSAFHDVTSNPQGQGYTEATVFGPAYGLRPHLTTMGLCATTPAHQACGAGYDTTSGIGSPGPSFFRSFGSHPCANRTPAGPAPADIPVGGRREIRWLCALAASRREWYGGRRGLADRITEHGLPHLAKPHLNRADPDGRVPRISSSPRLRRSPPTPGAG